MRLGAASRGPFCTRFQDLPRETFSSVLIESFIKEVIVGRFIAYWHKVFYGVY